MFKVSDTHMQLHGFYIHIAPKVEIPSKGRKKEGEYR